MAYICFSGSGSSSISSSSSTSAQSTVPPVAAVAGAPRNVRDALNMLHQNKQEPTYGSNHYSGRNNDVTDNVNGTSAHNPAAKKYSSGAPASGSEYNNGTAK